MHFVVDKKSSVIEVISKIQIALTNKHFQRDFFNNVKTFKFIVLNFDVMYSVPNCLVVPHPSANQDVHV
jgi:hypothetical protein